MGEILSPAVEMESSIQRRWDSGFRSDKRVEIAENFHFSVSQMLSADERILRLFLEIKWRVDDRRLEEKIHFTLVLSKLKGDSADFS